MKIPMPLEVSTLVKYSRKMTGFFVGMQLLTIIVGFINHSGRSNCYFEHFIDYRKERTKEIGIRRALGAKPSEVKSDFARV